MRTTLLLAATLLSSICACDDTEGELDVVDFVRVGSASGDEAVDAVAIDADGALYVLGTLEGTEAEGATVLGQPYDTVFTGLFLARLDTTGDVEWLRFIFDDESRVRESSADVQGTGLAIDGHGDLIVTGVIRNNIDLGDGLPEVPDWTDEDVATFVAKYTATGELVWSRRYWGDNRYAWPSAPKIDADDNIVFLGIDQWRVDFGDGALDTFATKLVKLDTNGELVFARGLGQPAELAERALEVAAFEIDASGAIVLSALARGVVVFGDGFEVGAEDEWSEVFARFAPDGTVVAARALMDDAALGRATGMTLTDGGDFIVGGYSYSAGLLRGGFLARLDAEGERRWRVETDPTLPAGIQTDDHPGYGLNTFAVDGEGHPIVETMRGVAGYDQEGNRLWLYEYDARPARGRLTARGSDVVLFGRVGRSFEFASHAFDLEGAQWFRWDGFLLRFSPE